MRFFHAKYIIASLLLLSLFAGAASSSALTGATKYPQNTITIPQKDTLPIPQKDTLPIPQKDSTRMRAVADSLKRDTSWMVDTLAHDTTDSLLTQDTILMREKFLDAPIRGKNKDSLVYDVKKKMVYVYNSGDISYQDMNIKADYLTLDTEHKNVHAEGVVMDTTNKPTRPVFTQGSATYELDSMTYNMTSGKARILGVNTQEGEGKVYGGTVKKMKDNVIHMHNGRYTVCDAECPHFYMRMTKATVVPGKQTVFGPAYMVFEDVPVYFLAVPFGFFPQKRDRSSGIIFPEIGEERIKGFFVRNLGYYVALNDYLDFRVLGGIYTMGSWQVGAASNYSLRYKLRGNIAFDYANDVIGDKGSPDYVETKNIALRWSHSQDPKFNPGSTFSASVNYTSSSYNKYNAQDLNDYLNSQTTSSINYSKSWAGKPFSLSVNGAMSQNSQDSTMTISIPNVAFNVSRIAPFKRKLAVGKERWYEKIAFTYGLEFRNEAAQIKEKDFFKQAMFDKMRMGVNHTIPVSASFNVLKYLNISPGVNYKESWYFRSINQNWDPETERVVADTTRGFYRLWQASAALSFNTKLYGTYTMGRKKVTTLRHILTPSVTASFTPDNGSRYYKRVQTNADGSQFRDYSPFANEMFSVPTRGQSASIGISLNNTLEGKFPSSKDTTGFKKIKLIEQLSLTTSYNLIADSMNLAPIQVSLSTNILGKLPLNFSATFDPYSVDKNGNRINRYLVQDGGFLRLSSLNFSLGYSWTSKASRPSGQQAVNNPSNNTNDKDMADRAVQNSFFDNNEPPPMSSKDLALQAATQYYDFNIPWSFGFSYSFNYSDVGRGPQLQQSVNFNGSVNVTTKWALTASAGYDFQMKKLTPGAIRVTRDLHCWQMSFQWIPVGFRQSWSFNIAVKSSMLSDLLKWEKNNSFLDNYYGAQ